MGKCKFLKKKEEAKCDHVEDNIEDQRHLCYCEGEVSDEAQLAYERENIDGPMCLQGDELEDVFLPIHGAFTIEAEVMPDTFKGDSKKREIIVSWGSTEAGEAEGE